MTLILRHFEPNLAFLQNAVQFIYNFFSYSAAKLGRECSQLENNCMQIILLIWLMLGLLASIIVVAALMLSSRISQEEGVSERYEHRETSEVVREIYPQQVEP